MTSRTVWWMAMATLALGAGCGGDTTGNSAASGPHTGGTGGTPQGGSGGTVVALGGAGGVTGTGGAAGGAVLPDLCRTTVPRPPGCPCTSESECDGVCLAVASTSPCEAATDGICTNPPHGGCVCSLTDGGPELWCIEREVCPETRPTTGEACTLLAMPCDYDAGAHERCWCMNRFGSPAWECMTEDAACPYLQPTPDSDCAGNPSCLFVTVSSHAYRCDCTEARWTCQAVVG